MVTVSAQLFVILASERVTRNIFGLNLVACCARREGAKRPMRTQFPKLGVIVKIMSRTNSAKRGHEAPYAMSI